MGREKIQDILNWTQIPARPNHFQGGNAMVTQAPFETFPEHALREQSDEPYNGEFIQRCREKALEYDKLDRVLRASLLQGSVVHPDALQSPGIRRDNEL